MFTKFFTRKQVRVETAPQKTVTTPKVLQRPAFNAQEIWWCDVDGKGKSERPVLVFRKFNKDMFWGLPLSLALDDSRPPQFTCTIEEGDAPILSKMRILHAHRLVRRVGKISDRQLNSLNQTVLKLIQETNPLKPVRMPASGRIHFSAR